MPSTSRVENTKPGNAAAVKDGKSQGSRAFAFVHVDVFTSEPLQGNQLAVFTDARGLSDVEMQALARETNLAETTFVLPRDPAVEKERGVQVRIFTVAEELPFAGHPTLGTAMVLRGQHPELWKDAVTLELKVGKIPVTFTQPERAPVFGEMRQKDPEFGEIHKREDVALALGVKIEDIDGDLPVQTVSTGVPFAVVPLRSLAAVRGYAPQWSRLSEYLERSDAKFFYIVARETVDPSARLHARMIFYNGEDPATGSAAGCTAAWMVRHGVASSDEHVWIEQGLEIQRPSKIHVRASSAGDHTVHNVRVGGNVVHLMRGEVRF